MISPLSPLEAEKQATTELAGATVLVFLGRWRSWAG
jgi:hypothetical protein